MAKKRLESSGIKLPSYREIQKTHKKLLKNNYKALMKHLKSRLIHGAKTGALREILDLSEWKIGTFNEIALIKELKSLGYTVETEGHNLTIYL